LQQHHISAQCVILETPGQRQLRVESDSQQSEVFCQLNVIAIAAAGRGWSTSGEKEGPDAMASMVRIP